MPVQLDHPGVYIEEIPSGVRTITGVATSVTAFVGRAQRGPTDKPVVVTSYAEFERTFGGLWPGSRLGFSVRDFFLNGGSQAVVVRLFKSSAGTSPDNAKLAVGTLILQAREPGAWGNALRARVDYQTRVPNPTLGETALFNLYIRDGTTGVLEEHRNLVVAVTVGAATDHPRFVTNVLANQSRLVTLTTPGAAPPAESGKTVDPGKTVWDDNSSPTNSKITGATNTADDGVPITSGEFIGAGLEAAKKGLYSLENTDLVNLLVIPPYKDDGVEKTVVTAAAQYCEKRRAMLLVDPLPTWRDRATVVTSFTSVAGFAGDLGTISKNAALFFPRLRQPNPLQDNQVQEFAPSGAVAGVMARTDAQRGVWKAPAGLDATLVGVPELTVPLTDDDIGQLNPRGVNCLRALPGAGRVVWGSRTMQGADLLASEWKYLPVRRTALFLEESLYRGTQWVVFEPNDEPLWAQIRLSIGTFMNNLFRLGAFQGTTPREAYFVKCDKETTTQADIDLGIVNIFVGFAPLKPAEFVVIRLQQVAGQGSA